LAVASTVVLAGSLAGCSSPARPEQADVLAIPLTTSLGGGGRQWAAIPMGQPGSVADTFWELFYKAGPASHWAEVTPPGVADSGGLAIAGGGASGSSLTVGFEPVLLLGFSPLAATADGGRSWSAGTLQGKLAPVVGAVAAGSNGAVLALVRDGGGQLYYSPGGLAQWSMVTTRAELAATPAGRQCSLTALTAVALVGGADIAGGACAKPGVVGILTSQAGGWHLSGPQLPPAYRAGTTEVLRIDASSGGGLSVLVAVRTGSGAAVLALRRAPGSQSWSDSAAVALPYGADLESTGFDSADGDYLVLYRPVGGATTLSYSSSTAAWHTTRNLPAGTSAAVFTATGSFDAITHSEFEFRSWTLSPQGTWTVEQSVYVPVPLGSNG
jgi:hypothetical protein